MSNMWGFIFILLLIHFHFISCDNNVLKQSSCSGAHYNSSNGIGRSNLDHLLSILPDSASQNGFFNTSVGEKDNQIFGIAICLAGISSSNCRSCLKWAVLYLQNFAKCSYSKSAVIWYDLCMVLYRNHKFFGISRSDNSRAVLEGNKEASGGGLETTVGNLTRKLSNLAANDSVSQTMFAVGQASYSLQNKDITIHGLAQCTRDLSPDNCYLCLLNHTIILKNQSEGNTYTEANIFGESCFLRYSEKPIIYRGLDWAAPSPTPAKVPTPTDLVPTAQPTEEGGKTRSKSTLIIIVSAVSGVAGLAIIIICLVWLWKAITKVPNSKLPELPMLHWEEGKAHSGDPRFEGQVTTDSNERPDICMYTLDELKAATENFSTSKKLGGGGFGEVYEAVVDGKLAAVKRLFRANKENEQELQKELSLVANIEHPNILKLLGYCFEDNQYLFVYEYMPHGSLDRHWRDPERRQRVNWTTRFKIIKGIANGLAHLHYGCENNILHVDLKLENILLSKELTAKIADFDLLRAFEIDETHQSTERGHGTPGYMAPEVNLMAPRKQYSPKSDVYSFGIIVLEIVTGERINTFEGQLQETLTKFVWDNWNRKMYQELVDACLLDVNQTQRDNDQAVRCLHIGLLCIQNEVAKRPDMLDVQKMLNSKQPLPPPSTPGFLSDEKSVPLRYQFSY